MRERLAGNWIQGFRYFTSESECPDNYLAWAALFTLSAAVQRQLWFHWIYWDFYPNIYVLLVGPPGKVHKNAAINFSRKMLREIEVPTASESITREALIQQMRNRPNVTGNQALAVTASEFDSFVDASGPRMIGFLTDIYDCEDDWEYTTKGGGTQRIESPYLTILGGLVPTWIANNFDQTFMDSGFCARTVFVVEDNPRFRKATANVTPKMKLMHSHLIEDLKHIAQLHGEFEWTPEAEAWFIQWYENVWDDTGSDYRISSFLVRKPTHVIRISMLISLAENDELLITKLHMETALGWLEALEPNMASAFSAVGRNPLASDLERIAADIMSSPEGISLGELLKRNTHSVKKQELDEILMNLQYMGMIHMEMKEKHPHYYPIESV